MNNTKMNWADKLEQSLQEFRKRDETVACGFDVPIEQYWESEFNDTKEEHFRMLMTVTKAVWSNKIGPFTHLLNVALASTQSPIEKAMLAALMVAGYSVAQGVVCRFTDKSGFQHTIGDTSEDYQVLLIELQKPMGKYRVDFALSYREYGPDHERTVRAKTGQEIPGSAWFTGELILECDGHDFHDRTKEQASADRERDRILQDLGYRVFRYTGSDLWKDVFKCAEEAVKAVSKSDHLKKMPILNKSVQDAPF